MVIRTYQEMAEFLKESSTDRFIRFFHAKVDKSSEVQVPSEFMKPDSRIRCLISTIAFGLGMQVPDISYIIHWGAPSTILDYWQEVGRCARNNKPGWAKLYTPPFSVNPKHCDSEVQGLVKLEQGSCLRRYVLRHLKIDNISQDAIDVCCGGESCCSHCDTN